MGFPGGTAVKNLPASSGDTTDMGLIPALDYPLEEGQNTPVFWPGESHGLYSPCSRQELDMTEGLSLHFQEI